MKTLAAAMTLALAALAAAGPAAAARHHHHHSGHAGYYEGNRQYHIDSRDRASSPYAGGVG